jgi:uncharacterized protein (DUF885 family)
MNIRLIIKVLAFVARIGFEVSFSNAISMVTPAKMSPSDFVAQEFAATWQWRIDTDPELAAALGMLSRRRSKHALDPRSLESFEQRLSWVDRALQRINNGITQDEIKECLTKDEQLSLDLYVKQLEDYTTYTKKHKSYLCCVNRLEGPQTDLALYCRYLPLKTKADREFFRDFLGAIPKQLMEVQALLEQGLSENITPPQVRNDRKQSRIICQADPIVFCCRQQG